MVLYCESYFPSLGTNFSTDTISRVLLLALLCLRGKINCLITLLSKTCLEVEVAKQNLVTELPSRKTLEFSDQHLLKGAPVEELQFKSTQQELRLLLIFLDTQISATYQKQPTKGVKLKKKE